MGPGFRDPEPTEEIMDIDTRQHLAELAWDARGDDQDPGDGIAYMIDRDGCMYRGQGRSDGIVDVEWMYLDDGSSGRGIIL